MHRSGSLFALRAALICTAALLFALPAGADAAINGFEGGDGNQASLCTTTTDWQCLPASAILAAEDASGLTDDGFVGGAKETQPDTWAFNTDTVQAKADLLGAWTSVSTDGDGGTYLNLAFARAGANGDTYLGIELNQSSATWVNAVGTTIPCRTDGDVLLSYAASNPTLISLFEWTGSAGPAGCLDGRTGTWDPSASLAHAFEARMNDAATTNYLDVPRLGNTLPAETFGEGSIDLGALADAFGDPVGTDGGCSYYRHMSVKTRSSAEVGSSLQDFANGSSLFARACETPEDDVTAPAAPSVSSAAMACALPVAISGTSEPGSTVTVYAGATPVAFAVADAGGAWSASIGGLAQGAHSLSAEATDVAGNTSVRSAAVGIVVDTTAPAAPTLVAEWAGAGMVDVSGTAEPGSQVTILDGTDVVATLTAAVDGTFATTLVGVANVDHSYTAVAADACRSSAPSAPAVVSGTDVVAPGAPTVSAPASSCTLPLLVSGTAEPGSTVALFDGTTAVGTTVADGTGAWQLSLATLSDGAHSLTADATDAAGNTSVRSVAVAVTIDATAPAAPSLTALRVGDDVQLGGSAEPGSTVAIREGDDVVATLTAAPDGSFGVTLQDVSDGAHTYRATAADACRTSDGTDASVGPKPDTTPPAVPTLSAPASSCTLPVAVSGTTEPGATVTVYDGTDAVGTTVADVAGAWGLSLGSLADGQHSLSAEAADAAGNTSVRSVAVSVTVDATAPAAPVLSVAWAGAGMVDLSGTAEPGTEVVIREGSTIVATLTAAANGAFATTLVGVDGVAHSYVAVASDACRTSVDSAPADLAAPADTTPPAAPVLSVPGSSCTLPVLASGTTEPGATVTVYDGASSVGTAVADGAGAWQLSLASLADGVHSLTADAADAAGNVSVRSAAVVVTIDTTAPAAPALNASRAGDDVQLSGSAEPGSQVVIREGSDVVATLTAAPDGTFAVTLEDVSPGAHTYRATAADACRTSDGTEASVGPKPDTTPPAAPTLVAPASSCSLPVLVSGTTEPGATVTVYDGASSLGTAVADGAGAWQLSLASLADGAHSLTADAADGAGNVSVRSAAVEVTVDTTAPAAPEIAARRVDADTVEVSGESEPGLPVTIREGEKVVAETTVGEDGAFAVEIAAADDVAHSYVASVADACRISGPSGAAVIPARSTDPVTPPTTDPQTTPAPTASVAPTPVVPAAPAPPAAPAETLRTVTMGQTNTMVRECMHKAFRAYLPLKTKRVRSARYYVDGKLAAVVRKPDALGQFYAVINPAKYAPGAHALTARVSFRTRSKKAVTLKLRFRRCDECQSRRSFRIRVPHLRNGERAVSARVYVNGRPTKVVKGKRLRARVVLTGLPRGTYKVKIVTRTNRGRIHRSTRTYRTCVPKKTKPKTKSKRR